MLTPSMPTGARSQFIATVIANTQVCREHYRLLLGVDHFPEPAPGQFVQIECRDGDRDYELRREGGWDLGSRFTLEHDELSAPLAMLRRPFSLAGRRDTDRGIELQIIHP